MVTNVKAADSFRRGLYKSSGVVALISGVLFLISLIGLVATQLGMVNVWFSQLQNNWLITLFKLNAGFKGTDFDLLQGLNPLDITILALVSAMYLGLYTALKTTSKIWSVIAAVQPFLGILLFIVTGMQGRSAVMGSTLVISFVMLRSSIFDKAIAFVGILASVLLLVGDFDTTANSQSSIIAIFIGIGYVLLIAWFFLVGQKLFRLGRKA